MKRYVLFLFCMCLSSIMMAQPIQQRGGQSHAVNVKLLSSTTEDHYTYEKTFTYDTENRVSAIHENIISQGWTDTKETTITYGSDQIHVNQEYNRDGRIKNYQWILTLENECVVKEEYYSEGELNNTMLYTYDEQKQIVHIDIQCPFEVKREDWNVSIDLNWSDGYLVSCQEIRIEKQNIREKNFIHTFEYNDIEDQTLVNYYALPYNHFEYECSDILPLLYCQNYYGRRMKTLLSGHKQTNMNEADEHNDYYTYQLNNEGRVSSLVSLSGSNNTPTTFVWGEDLSAISVPLCDDNHLKTFTIDGRPVNKDMKGLKLMQCPKGNYRKIMR